MFNIVCWKEFKNSKMISKAEIIKSHDESGHDESEHNTVIARMKQFNAEKKLTTTDYQVHNLSELFSAHNLEITEGENIFVNKIADKLIEKGYEGIKMCSCTPNKTCDNCQENKDLIDKPVVKIPEVSKAKHANPEAQALIDKAAGQASVSTSEIPNTSLEEVSPKDSHGNIGAGVDSAALANEAENTANVDKDPLDE